MSDADKIKLAFVTLEAVEAGLRIMRSLNIENDEERLAALIDEHDIRQAKLDKTLTDLLEG